ncbi:MAG: hypothetical protein ACPLQP_00925 [Moorellaceae bacterium]
MKDVLVTTPVQLFYWLDRGEVVMADLRLFRILFWYSREGYHMAIQPGFAPGLEAVTPERRDVEDMFGFWSRRAKLFVYPGTLVGSAPAPWWKKIIGRLFWKLMGT